MPSTLSLSPWSFEGLLLKGDMTLPEIVEKTAAMGVDSIDINEIYFGLSPNPDVPRLRSIRRLCASFDLAISSCWCWGDLLGAAVMESPEAALAHVERYMSINELLGAPYLTIQNGNPPAGMTVSEGRSILLGLYEKLAPMAEDYGVVIGFEAARAGSAFNSPQGALELAKSFGSPRLTVTPDFESWRRPTEKMPMRYAEDPDSVVADPLPVDVLAQCMPYSPFIHAKFLEFDETGTDPNYPLPAMFDAIRTEGSEHVYCIEYEGWIPDIHPDLDPVGEIQKAIDLLRKELL